MSELWLSLTDIPEQGQEYSYSEQDIWTGPIEEFQLPYAIIDPVQAEVFVLLREKGCLISGDLQGKVTLPCSRCAEKVFFEFEQKINVFELLPEEKSTGDFFGPEFLRWNHENLELNIGGILWEQFVLALPDKPLCQEDCIGICPECGQNKNLQLCNCAGETSDPRMEIFRRLKVKKD
ncbi:MAG: YceD family protein [Thermodesulfobacteriota bacterium]